MWTIRQNPEHVRTLSEFRFFFLFSFFLYFLINTLLYFRILELHIRLNFFHTLNFHERFLTKDLTAATLYTLDEEFLSASVKKCVDI